MPSSAIDPADVLERAEFRIHGMDCSQEVALIRRRLDPEKGIANLSFDVIQGKMAVEFDPHQTAAEKISSAVAETGLGCELWKDAVEPAVSWLQRLGHLSVWIGGVALAVGLVIQGFATGSVLGALLAHEQHEASPPAALALYLLAIVAGGHFLVPKALRSLAALRPDMNALVMISILGAGVLGEWAEGATLAFLFAVASRIESWSVARARREVGELMAFAPEEASVVHKDHEHRLAVERVVPGSTVRVRPGERIPCDGTITSGSSGVNEAMLTGEPVPVWKKAGDSVFAGSFNGDGMLEIRTNKVGSDTRLARILRMIEESQHHRAPAEQFVDRFARYYTPAMFILAALLTLIPPLAAGGGWSYWFYQGMLVLLISCPCALVISTPVTIVAAMASAARRGVLIKGGIHLEEAARVRAMAFDKTGVLTQGEPEVTVLESLGGRGARNVLVRLASIEHYSEHPLARAIVEYAHRQGARPDQVMRFRALKGKGAEADVGGQVFWIGNQRLVEERGANTEEVRGRVAALEDSGHTVVVCGSGAEAWAVVGLQDPVREEASTAINDLRDLGFERLIMLTGDNRRTALAVAGEVGLHETRAQMLPEDKTAAVQGVLAEEGKVAMVGDGINDAEAIATASLGVGIGSRAADVALETADVVLMSPNLHQLPFLVRHARRALSVIKQNVTIAVALKVVFLLFALFGWASLWMAVAADMGGTLIVIFNGLRLLKTRDSEQLRNLEPVPQGG